MKILPVTMIGVPSDHNSSYLQGAAGAPEALRKLMRSGMSNMNSENGCDIADEKLFVDIGDLALFNNVDDFEAIQSRAEELLTQGPCLFIGGDHSISWPIVDGLFQARKKKVHLVHIDAHPDLYPDFDNNPFSHASPMVRILENDLVESLTQIGIRTVNEVQKAQAQKYNVAVFHPPSLPDKKDYPLGEAYLSIDLDGIDPAFAPGVSHHEPGGLSVRDVIDIIWNINGPLIGADIVEYNPVRDINDMTTAVLLKLVKEVGARMAADAEYL